MFLKSLWVYLVIGILCSSPAWCGRLDATGCSRLERTSIEQAVTWLRRNLYRFDQQMGRDGLPPWHGRSRMRLVNRLRKSTLRFTCRNKKSCGGEKSTRLAVGDWSLPIRHKSRIELCTQQLTGIGQYVVVIVHELGHQVWANADRVGCMRRCTKPRMSDALSLVAYHLWHGTGHASAQCPAACSPKPVGDPAGIKPASATLQPVITTGTPAPTVPEKKIVPKPTVKPGP